MNAREELRASVRVPVSNHVKVVNKGRSAMYALAVNLSMGGLLLSASPAMAVGSPCRLHILPNGATGPKIVVEGTVVRNDAHGVAVKFNAPLAESTYERFAAQSPAEARTLLGSYRTYFQVSQDRDHQGAESSFGVDPRTFRRVVLTTFCTCVPVAIAPVLFLKGSLPDLPNWAKITGSFAYAGAWIGLIHPTIDLSIFRFLRNRNS